MKDQMRFPVYILLVFAFISCTVNNQSESSFKKFANYPCRGRQKNVFLFYNSDSINFKYKKLGLVEACGKAGDSDEQVRDKLKYAAYQNCANAIINIKTETIHKNYGGDFRTEARTYLSTVYRGTAVRIESDSLYKSTALGNSQDLSFLKNTFKYNHERQKKAKITAGIAVLASAVFIAIYVLTVYR